MKFFIKKKLKILSEYDELYKNTVIELNKETKIEYCESLIHRTLHDIKLINDLNEIKFHKELIQAAKEEIIRLKKL
ncbi:MAG: hypothetical protein IT220_02680 [Flavobacteriaceae bacterium]|nr:hypothetical protein [Flavobacteriaceae bacterium]